MKKINNLNDYATTPVPEGEGKGWVSIALIVVGVGIAIPAFFLASIISTSLSVTQSILAIYGGGVIYTIFAVIMGIIGHKKRVSTYLILKEVFGSRGYYPLVILMSLVLSFWFAFNLEVFAVSIGEVTSGNIPVWMFVLVGGILMTSTASMGFKGLRMLSMWVVPLLGLILLWALVKSAIYEPGTMSIIEGGSVGMFMSIVAGTFMVGATLMPDITRYSRSSKDAIIGSLVGYLVAGPTVLLVMTMLAKYTGQNNFFEVLHALGLGSVGFVVLVFAVWTTNDNNAYSSSLALTSVIPKIQKKHFTWAIGLLGTCIALFGVLGNFLTFVLLLGVVITPVAGIVGLEVLYFSGKNSVQLCNTPALIAWVVGTISAIMTTPANSLGLELFTLTSVPSVDAVLVASIIYWLLRRVSK